MFLTSVCARRDGLQSAM